MSCKSILFIAKYVTPVSGKQHPYRCISTFFACVSCAPTYSNFTSNEISVFGIGARINRRYYSCNWQSWGNFWLVWNSFLRLYYDYLSSLTSCSRPWWPSMRSDDEFVRYYHRQYHRFLMREKAISYLPNVVYTNWFPGFRKTSSLE